MKMKFFIVSLICMFALVGCGSRNTAEINGFWSIDEAMNVSTQGSIFPTYIEFAADGICHGNGGVNYFSGKYALDGENLSFSNMGSTKMMGPNMNIEDAVNQALEAAASIKVDGDKAYVLNADGDTIMSLSKADASIAEIEEPFIEPIQDGDSVWI
ncbi:MAG: META domain-containing protein [Bacteroidales bacterium]|nr:META domain-containing protein [Bacteroidales bacterium]